MAQRLGVQYLSIGDLLRNEVETASALGRAVEHVVASGQLVPTDLILAIVEANLDPRGYVLDGYPRTLAQARALLERPALAPTIAIEIVVPARVALERLTARGRHDDDSSVARARLAIYENETVPALEWLDRRGLRVRVSGVDTPDVVARHISGVLPLLLVDVHLQGTEPNARFAPA